MDLCLGGCRLSLADVRCQYFEMDELKRTFPRPPVEVGFIFESWVVVDLRAIRKGKEILSYVWSLDVIMRHA